MKKEKPFLADERKQTDESLDAERDKTNQSLAKSQTKTEDQIDKVVSNGRLEADQARETARAKADSKDENRQAASGSAVEEEKRIGQVRVELERERFDKSIERERAHADEALEKERAIKSELASRLLEQERKLTDRNLSFERNQTDFEVLRTSGLLDDEKTEHSKTKISLTTRNEFLAIVSHDLRSPIGAASSCAGMLLEDPEFSSLNPELKYWLEFIKRNVDLSLRMIGDLLDLERIAVGKLQLKLEKQGIGKIIRQSIESFAYQASAKNIQLSAAPISGSDEVVCDHDRVLQVLSNLIGNALKFTPEKGAITVGVSTSTSEVQVSIKDTGPGIPEDKLAKIFDRFTQLGLKDRKGLGLGLYISKMLIDSHGGRIWVESKLNQGTTLHFTIPRSPPNS